MDNIILTLGQFKLNIVVSDNELSITASNPETDENIGNAVFSAETASQPEDTTEIQPVQDTTDFGNEDGAQPVQDDNVEEKLIISSFADFVKKSK